MVITLVLPWNFLRNTKDFTHVDETVRYNPGTDMRFFALGGSQSEYVSTCLDLGIGSNLIFDSLNLIFDTTSM